MRALGGVYGYVGKSGLPKALVDLVYLRTSQINGCAYCINMHSQGLIEAGVPVEKLMLLSVWRDADALFTPKEQAALQWAEALTLIDGAGVPDATYQAAIAHFTEKELVDLTLAVGLINNCNRLSIAPEGVPVSRIGDGGARTRTTSRPACRE
jgi:AhpD family alkylhydroperoxidase